MIKIPTLKRDQILPYFVGGILIFAAVLVFFVYRSFAWSAFLATLLYVGFDSTNRQLMRLFRGNKTLTATVTTLFVVVSILTPLLILTNYILNEIVFIAFQIREITTFDKGLAFLQRFPVLLDLITADEFFWLNGQGTFIRLFEAYGNYIDPEKLDIWLEDIYNLFLGSMSFTIQFAADILFGMILLFFMFRDGPRLYRRVSSVLPVPDELVLSFLQRMREMILAVLKGSVFVSILQGLVLGIGLMIVKIPNSILYATIGAIFSLVPIIGTAVIWIPAALYLAFMQDSFGGAIFLSLWGLGAYLFLENIFKPRFLDSKLGIHSLFLFFSIIGGIKEFGPSGIVLGPLFVALFATLWSIYHIWEPELDREQGD